LIYEVIVQKIRIFVDTNVILEALRTQCWTAICNRYAIETVEKCIEEALTGNPDVVNRTPVQRKVLVDGLTARHKVRGLDLASLALSYPECEGLDAGELHLFSYLHAQGMIFNHGTRIATADKAAIRFTEKLGWLSSIISLEELVMQSGVTNAQISGLRAHYRNSWLSEIKTKIFLGIM
jgi:hypothetical protein